MTLESSLFTFVTTDAVVGPLIAGTRMYPGKLPQTPVFPSLTYNRISSTQEYEFEGDEVDVRPSRFQIDAWDDGYDGMTVLAEAVRTRLTGHIGAMGTDTVQFIEIEDMMDEYETETQLWRRIIDFIVWYE